MVTNQFQLKLFGGLEVMRIRDDFVTVFSPINQCLVKILQAKYLSEPGERRGNFKLVGLPVAATPSKFKPTYKVDGFFIDIYKDTIP